MPTRVGAPRLFDLAGIFDLRGRRAEEILAGKMGALVQISLPPVVSIELGQSAAPADGGEDSGLSRPPQSGRGDCRVYRQMASSHIAVPAHCGALAMNGRPAPSVQQGMGAGDGVRSSPSFPFASRGYIIGLRRGEKDACIDCPGMGDQTPCVRLFLHTTA